MNQNACIICGRGATALYCPDCQPLIDTDNDLTFRVKRLFEVIDNGAATVANIEEYRSLLYKQSLNKKLIEANKRSAHV